MQVMVLGCGSWGMALSMLLCENGHTVTLWAYDRAECEQVRVHRTNPKLLPDVLLPDAIEVTNDLEKVREADCVVLAVPSFAVAQTASALAPLVKPGAVIVNVGKGLDSTHGYCRFSQTIEQAMGQQHPVVVLTGPTHAEEVARRIPTAILAASTSKEAAEQVQDIFMNPRFRVYTSSDVVGAELGGAFKNIIALAAGIIDGLGLGDNTKAALMTRGLTEIARLGVALGASKETFAGLSGVGDLIVTCTSMHSRNRRAGILIGQGMPVEQALAQIGAVVEGYYATKAGYCLAQQVGVSMPITESLYHVLYEGANVEEGIRLLMTREKTHENEELWLS